MMRAVIAVVAILVVVAGIFLLQNRGENKSTTPSAVSGSSDSKASMEQVPPSVQIVKPETHVISCAEPDFLDDKFTDKEGKVVTVLEKGQSSEGTVLTFLRSPKWLNKCKIEETEEAAAKYKEVYGKMPGLAIYNFDVERDDEPYYVYLYAKWTDTCGNSCLILMNGPEKGGHEEQAKEFKKIEDQLGEGKTQKEYNPAWHPLVSAGAPVKFWLKKGKNRIEIHTREDGPTFYQLVVTTEASTPAGGPMKKKS